MRYYTEIIPATLEEKLKEKGMPIEKQHLRYAKEGESKLIPPTYSKVLDWLMEKGIRITLHTYPAREPFAWEYRLWIMDGGIIYDPNPAPEIMKLDCQPTWHEAANAAIAKALTLI